MREFADMWFDAFGTWPVTWGQYAPISDSRWYSSSGVDLDAFSMAADKLRDYVSASHRYDQKGGVEIAMRRWLQAEPSAAPEIVAKSREITLQFSYGDPDVRSTGPSVELLMLWAKIDQAGMVRWADPLDPKKDPVALEAKGMLMSRVDPETRKRWLAEAQFPDKDGDFFSDLFTDWAGWDPVAALETAVASRNAVAIEEAGYGAAFGPFDRQPLNSSGFGLGVIKKFDVASLPPLLLGKATRRDVVYNWGCDGIMEQWGAIDIGETARYGLDFLLRTNYPSKDRLIRLFTKGDPTLGDDAMNDRTFCALRVWAVFKPKEMAAWISTLKDADLRKALTWLLNHPWAPGLDY